MKRSENEDDLTLKSAAMSRALKNVAGADILKRIRKDKRNYLYQTFNRGKMIEYFK